jgi:hypothetical protein
MIAIGATISRRTLPRVRARGDSITRAGPGARAAPVKSRLFSTPLGGRRDVAGYPSQLGFCEVAS